MPHLTNRDESHISIRLWQWLRTGNRPPQNTKGTQRPTTLTPEARLQLARLGISMGFGTVAGTGPRMGADWFLRNGRWINLRTGEILEKWVSPSAIWARQQRIKAIKATFKIKGFSQEEISNMSIRSLRKISREQEAAATAKVVTLATGAIIATGLIAVGIAKAVEKLSAREFERQLNKNPNYTSAPDGSRLVANGREYVRIKGTWFRVAQ